MRLSVLSYCFTKIVKVFTAFFQCPVFVSGKLFLANFLRHSIVCQGFTCLVHLDDLLIFFCMDAFVRQPLCFFFPLLCCFGLTVNRCKSDF